MINHSRLHRQPDAGWRRSEQRHANSGPARACRAPAYRPYRIRGMSKTRPNGRAPEWATPGRRSAPETLDQAGRAAAVRGDRIVAHGHRTRRWTGPKLRPRQRSTAILRRISKRDAAVAQHSGDPLVDPRGMDQSGRHGVASAMVAPISASQHSLRRCGASQRRPPRWRPRRGGPYRTLKDSQAWAVLFFLPRRVPSQGRAR